jgi:hypothetical protein
MDGRDTQDRPGCGMRDAIGVPFSFPVAPSHYDRMLAAAHALSLDMLANTATAPIIDADNCADWLVADFARDRRTRSDAVRGTTVAATLTPGDDCALRREWLLPGRVRRGPRRLGERGGGGPRR